MGRSVAMPSQDVILDARKDAGEAVKIRAGSRPGEPQRGSQRRWMATPQMEIWFLF